MITATAPEGTRLSSPPNPPKDMVELPSLPKLPTPEIYTPLEIRRRIGGGAVLLMSGFMIFKNSFNKSSATTVVLTIFIALLLVGWGLYLIKPYLPIVKKQLEKMFYKNRK